MSDRELLIFIAIFIIVYPIVCAVIETIMSSK